MTPPTPTKITYKDPHGKLIKLTLTTDPATNTITTIQITGDFFAYPEEAIDILETGLPGTPITQHDLHQKITFLIDTHHLQLIGLTPEGLTQAILKCLP